MFGHPHLGAEKLPGAYPRCSKGHGAWTDESSPKLNRSLRFSHSLFSLHSQDGTPAALIAATRLPRRPSPKTALLRPEAPPMCNRCFAGDCDDACVADAEPQPGPLSAVSHEDLTQTASANPVHFTTCRELRAGVLGVLLPGTMLGRTTDPLKFHILTLGVPSYSPGAYGSSGPFRLNTCEPPIASHRGRAAG